jgi:hypothetical protein
MKNLRILCDYNDITNCITDACDPGSFSQDGLLPCSPCAVGYYQSMYGQYKCVPCPVSMTTSSFAAVSVTECKSNFDF